MTPNPPDHDKADDHPLDQAMSQLAEQSREVETQDRAEVEGREVERLVALQCSDILAARIGFSNMVAHVAGDYLYKARADYPGISLLIEERFWLEVEALALVPENKLDKDFTTLAGLYEKGNYPHLEIGPFQVAMWAYLADEAGYKSVEQHTVKLLRCLVMPNARQISSSEYQA